MNSHFSTGTLRREWYCGDAALRSSFVYENELPRGFARRCVVASHQTRIARDASGRLRIACR
jgi:hypothetical protein